MPVDRCVCFDVTFAKMKAMVDRDGCDLSDLHARTGCGSKCGLCLPYIQLMLRTGEVIFPIHWAEDFRAEGVKPGAVERMERRLHGELLPEGMPVPPPGPVIVPTVVISGRLPTDVSVTVTGPAPEAREPDAR
ncbi:MAG: hypothetical protein SFY95_00420 [Planctomycetota bacterium]|nr:hypothetical protein [Planctomycetota bacterium]